MALPAEQYELGGEAGAHGDHQPEGARRWRVGHGVLENVQHGNRRQVSIVAQRLSGEFERFCGQVERIFDRVDHLWAGRVQDPSRDVGGGQPVVGEEVVDVFTQVFLDDGGDLDGQDDLEPVGADVPAQPLFGVRVGTAPGGEEFRSDGWPVGSGRDDGGGTITEQTG